MSEFSNGVFACVSAGDGPIGLPYRSTSGVMALGVGRAGDDGARVLRGPMGGDEGGSDAQSIDMGPGDDDGATEEVARNSSEKLSSSD